jgi:predicted AlkP superfamily pyrophosphatase or phosphodiesterase
VLIISVDGLAGYLLTDPGAPLPTIRGLADAGASAPKGMVIANPTITWPNHTSLVTGTRSEKHGVLFNGILERTNTEQPVNVNPRKTKDELVRVPTIYDVAYAAGLSTGEVNWPCTSEAKSIDWRFPDAPDAVSHMTPAFREELFSTGILPRKDPEKFGAAGSPVSRDVVWTQAMRRLIIDHKPRLMLFHLLNVDAVHHRYGPQTFAGYSANGYADACVKQVLQALSEAGIRDKTAVFIVADHGFNKVEKVIQGNVALRKAGLLETAGPRVLKARVQMVAEGGTAHVYFNDPAARAEKDRVVQLFRGTEGIADVVEPSGYAALGLPDPKDNGGMGDLLLVAKRGYAFLDTPIGESVIVPSTTYLGTHGYVASDANMNATFVAAGPGIKRGVTIDNVRNIDVAPTAAALLGLTMPTAQGRVLTEILEK